MSYLKVTNFSKTINQNKILNNVSFDLDKGQALVILGKSGAGKTTLIRNINLLDYPDTGILELDGEMLYNYKEGTIPQKELQKRHKLIGMVFQSFNLFPHYNVLQNVCLAVELENKEKVKKLKKEYKGVNKKEFIKNASIELKKETTTKALEIINNLGLSEKINSYPYQLSGGEQQRVAIARALILNPKILCFDEPTSALDPLLKNEVIKVINELKQQNHTMIIITHDIDFANIIADKIIEMENGEIIKER